MKVAVVNPFDPVPGEGLRDARYGAFCEALVGAGNRVAWISSEWCHILKQRRNYGAVQHEAEQKGFEIYLVPSRPYSDNVSVARWLNHREIARRIPPFLERMRPRPDVVLVSVPPPNLAVSVARWCSRYEIPLVVDVQDLWPETFGRLLPRAFKSLNSVIGHTMRRNVRTTYSLSSAGLAVSEYYAEHFEAHGGSGRVCHKLHLGTNLSQFDRNIVARDTNRHLLGSSSEKRLIFSGGSMGSGLNWTFLLDVASRLKSRQREDLHLVVAGSGPEENWVRNEIQGRFLDNVTLLGQQPYSVFCSLAASADIGVNHFRPDSFVVFPNRVFDYFAADLPVLNTIPGELAGLITLNNAGFSTLSFDVDAAVRFIETRVAARPSVAARQAPCERRGDWVTEFDRPAIASRLPDILDSVVKARRGRKAGTLT